MAAENIAYASEITGQITVTPAAAEKLAELLAEADPGISAIRVFVTGGGCGGMQYGLTFADEASKYDCRLEADNYKLYIDSVALAHMEGCEIDYGQQGLNASFIFNNVFQSVGGSGGCSGCGGGGF